DWQGLTPLDRIPHMVNPPLGWLYNTNDGPWWGAGPASPKQADYPRYTDDLGENARGWHASALLNAHRGLTLESLVSEVAFDPALHPGRAAGGAVRGQRAAGKGFRQLAHALGRDQPLPAQ